MTGRLSEILLADPRGFCGGVTRAIALVKKTLADFGAPVYVRHEIVHNKHVVEDLRRQGVIFIEDWSEMDDPSRPVIISAHGAPQTVYDEAKSLGLKLVDATCPLVAKVHEQYRRLAAQNLQIIVIGKKEHPEITGTIGQCPGHAPAAVINTVEEAENLALQPGIRYGVVTQTTLAVDEVSRIIDVLAAKPGIELATQNKNDICYATTHRQAAVKELARQCSGVIVIGSKNSSNSRQLQKTAEKAASGQEFKAWLADDVSEIDWDSAGQIERLGVTAGASAPDYLVDELLAEARRRYPNLKIRYVTVTAETKIP